MKALLGKQRRVIPTTWSNKLAYTIGIIATDGNLSPDLRHISITSKDLELVLNIKKALGIKNKIGKKARGGSKDKKYFVLQFGNVIFYNFLLSIGLTPKKSKTIGQLEIPDKFFRDFTRGCIDGDGNINFFFHKESKHPQLRVRLASASLLFLQWIQRQIKRLVLVNGGWLERRKNKSELLLCYGKQDAIKLLKYSYAGKESWFLKRKYLYAKEFIGK